MIQLLAAVKGRSVCGRLLDVGADKPLPFLAFFAESNPALGRIGIRLLREYPEPRTTAPKIGAMIAPPAAVIFRLLRLVHDDLPQMPLSVCGELAGRPSDIAHVIPIESFYRVGIRCRLKAIIIRTHQGCWGTSLPAR